MVKSIISQRKKEYVEKYYLMKNVNLITEYQRPVNGNISKIVNIYLMAMQ